MRILMIPINVIALICLLAGANMGQAATVTPLLAPPGVVGPKVACAPIGFAADDSVYGACHTVSTPPCSGRGCQPTTTTINYIVTWDTAGNPTLVGACDQVVYHLPGADKVTYLNGHSAADCFAVNLNPTGTTVFVPNGSGGGSYYPYVSASADGAYELVVSALVTF